MGYIKMDIKIEAMKQTTECKIKAHREEQKQALESIMDMVESMLKDVENERTIYEVPSLIAYAQRLGKTSLQLEGLNERLQMLNLLQK